MDKENVIKMFKLANSNLSTLSYQINSLNYNPSISVITSNVYFDTKKKTKALHQFDNLHHFFSFFKQRINTFEAEFHHKTEKITQKVHLIPFLIFFF